MSLTKSDELIFPIGFDQLRSQLACNGVYNVYIYRSSSFSELSSAVISLLFLLSSVNYTFTKFAKKMPFISSAELSDLSESGF